LRDDVLPMFAAQAETSGDRHVWCWSAGCASGEEIYTLNIIWKLCVSPRFPRALPRLIATDSDSRMLDRAAVGRYSTSSVKDLPSELLSTAFIRLDGMFGIKPEFRGNVELRLQDIRHEQPSERFQLILCRHLVFTYFDERLQRQILDRLVDRLVTGGILVTGKQEPLPGLPSRLREYGRRVGMYRRAA
jgi:chemotaxis protein methyltransferase CheR